MAHGIVAGSILTQSKRTVPRPMSGKRRVPFSGIAGRAARPSSSRFKREWQNRAARPCSSILVCVNHIKDDIDRRPAYVPLGLNTRHPATDPTCRKSRGNAACPMNWIAHYSITSSARARSVGGTGKPRAVAVFMLITNSYFADCATGRSEGFSPLRIRPV
jgi:hypothetical protein